MKYISVTEDGVVELFNNTPEFLKAVEDYDHPRTYYKVGDEITVKTGIKIRKVKLPRNSNRNAGWKLESMERFEAQRSSQENA
jgi:hypothetical protein